MININPLHLAPLIFFLISLHSPPTHCHSAGAPCEVQHTLTPSITYHGQSQNVVTNPPPFRLRVLDETGVITHTYVPGKIYTVRVSGSSFFRGFILQPRLADENGNVLGAEKVGRFIEDQNWARVGIKYHQCSDTNQNSVTHFDERRKYYVNIQWTADNPTGPVQFVATLVKNQTYFWKFWEPTGGLLKIDPSVQTELGNEREGQLISSESIRVAEGGSNTLPEFSLRPAPPINLITASTAPPIYFRTNLPDTTPAIIFQPRTNPPPVNFPPRIILTHPPQPPQTEPPQPLTQPPQPETDAPEPQTFPTQPPQTFPPQPPQTFPTQPPQTFPPQPPQTFPPIPQTFPPQPTQPPQTEPPIQEPQTVPPTPIFVEVPVATNAPFQQASIEETEAPEIEDPQVFEAASAVPTQGPQTAAITAAWVRPTSGPYVGPSTPRVWPPVGSQLNLRIPPFPFIHLVPVEDGDIFEEENLDDDNIDRCASNPCVNGGTCENEPGGFFCNCPERWTGDDCNVFDYCSSNPCASTGVCKLSEQLGYECICDPGWSGQKCDLVCPEYVCKNGGTCKASASGQYSCKCPDGWTGDDCATEIDECTSNPCKHNGECVDQFNGFRCSCAPGYSGKSCEKPCVDIYHTCRAQWDDEDRCELMRPLTQFFDNNCAVTCGQCIPGNFSRDDIPPLLPPILTPVKWLVGSWLFKSEQPSHFPLDFQEKAGYEETLNFWITQVPMFGTPALNYTSMAISKGPSKSVQTTEGFFSIAPRAQPIIAALTSVSNAGIMIIEEGTLDDEKQVLILKTVFNSTLPHLKQQMPKMLKRTFTISGVYLSVSTDLEMHDNQKKTFLNYYSKVWSPQYL